MTQAFNLAQLANNLNTSGQLDATDGLSGLVATANLASGSASSSTYLRGDQTWASITTGKILQVVQTVNSSASYISMTSSEQDITGLSVSITPSSTSSRVFVFGNINGGFGGSYASSAIRVKRGTTTIYQGDVNGNRTRGTIVGSNSSQMVDGYGPNLWSIMYVDSPATTSSTTYKFVCIDADGTGNGFYLNRSSDYTDSINYFSTASSIIVMEIAP